MERKLLELFSVDERCQTIGKLTSYLRSLGIQVWVDESALNDYAISSDAELDVSSPRIVRIKDGLRQLLRGVGLVYRTRNGILEITTPDQLNQDLAIRVYDVTSIAGGDLDSLIDLTTSVVASDAWYEVGGPATVSPYVVNDRLLLVISQTQDVHETIGGLYARLQQVGGAGSPSVPRNSEIRRSRLPKLRSVREAPRRTPTRRSRFIPSVPVVGGVF